MQIPFDDFLKEYKNYLEKMYSSRKYQNQIVHDSFCFVGMLNPSNFLLSCWDDYGMDNLYLDLIDCLKENGEEEPEKQAHLFRLSIGKLSLFLHNKYKSYRDLPSIEIPQELEAFENHTRISRVNYGPYIEKVLSYNPRLLYLAKMSENTPKAAKNEWRTLIEKAQKGDGLATNRLFGVYMDRILKCALLFSERYHAELDDCIQEALMGFYEAVTKYPAHCEQPFPAYYQLWIQKNLYRNISVGNTVFRYPVHVKQKLYEIIDQINKVDPGFFDFDNAEELLCEVTAKIEAKKSVEEYVKLLLPSVPFDLSAEKKISNSNEICETPFYNKDPYDGLWEWETTKQIDDALKELKPKEAEVIRMRYGFKGRVMTLEEVSNVYGLTRERIRQIEVTALRKLKLNRQLSCFVNLEDSC